MRLLINAIGKSRTGAETTLIDGYLDRAKPFARQLGINGPTLKTYEAARGLTGEARTKDEGRWLLQASEGTRLIALDETGAQIDSIGFSRLIETTRDDGAHGVSFVIGGADGLSGLVKNEAMKTVAFGKATWPHMLVRVMLSEQVYRSMTILCGHPYHRS